MAADAVLIPLVRWRLDDDTVGDSYVFEINPNEGGTPPRKKNLTTQSTTAPDGKPIIFEGQDEVLNASVSGVILNEDQLAVLTEWFKRRHLVKLTDDLGRAYIIYLTGLQAGRQRSAHYHWKHTYTLEYTVFEEL